MDIITFLNKHKLKWAYITIVNGCPVYYNTNESYNYNHFYDDNNDEWKYNQELRPNDRMAILNTYNKIDKYRLSDKTKYEKYKSNSVFIAYGLDNICVIDIDNEQLFKNNYSSLEDTLKTTYQYKSRTKRYKHYIVKMEVNEPRLVFKDNLGNEVGDILNRQSPWVRIDEIVEGEDFEHVPPNSLITNYILKKPKQEKKTKKLTQGFGFIPNNAIHNTTEIDDLLSIIDEDYWDEFQSWISIGLSLKGLYGEVGLTLWDKFSMKSDKYDEDELQSQWESFKVDEDKVSVRTIARLALKSDQWAYYKWVIKYAKGYKYMLHSKKPFNSKFLKYLLKMCEPKFILNNQFTEIEKKEKKQKPIFEKYFEKNTTIVLAYVNQYICYVATSSTLIIKHDYNKYGHIINPTIFKSDKDLLKALSNYVFKNKYISKKLINVLTLWNEYEYKRVFDEFVYEPGKYYDYVFGEWNKFNSWYGWKYTYEPNFKVNTDLLTELIFHLKEITCDGDMELYSYMIRVFKLILQGIKPEVAFLIHGKKGSGKSMIFEWFGKNIVGQSSYAYVNNIAQLTNRFNSYITSKSFTVCDELAIWEKNGNTANYEMMKSLITQKQIPYERKGQESILMDDFNCFVMISNNFLCYPMGDKSNRRICASKVNESKVGNFKYFEKLNKCMEDDNICKHFFHFIMNLDMDSFNVKAIPNTKYRRELISSSTPSEIAYLVVFLQKCINNKDFKKFSCNTIKDNYHIWCELNDITRINSYMFKKWNLIDAVRKCGYRISKERGFSFSMESSKQIINILLAQYEIDESFYYDGCKPNIVVPQIEEDTEDSEEDSENSDEDSDEDSNYYPIDDLFYD